MRLMTNMAMPRYVATCVPSASAKILRVTNVGVRGGYQCIIRIAPHTHRLMLSSCRRETKTNAFDSAFNSVTLFSVRVEIGVCVAQS